MKTKKHDFIELHYTGYANDKAFDTTEETIAKKENIDKKNAKYGPKIICIGENWVLKGLDQALLNKELNKEYETELQQAFGKKLAKLIQIIPTSTLTKQKIRPFPGLQIFTGNLIGTIRTVTGGRTTVDFNHPLAGKNIKYNFKITKIILSNIDKTKAMLDNGLRLKDDKYNIKETNNKINIKVKPKIPEEVKSNFIKKAKEFKIEVAFNDN